MCVPELASEKTLMETLSKVLTDRSVSLGSVECIVWVLRRITEFSTKQAKKVGLNPNLLKLIYARMMDRFEQEHQSFLMEMRSAGMPQQSFRRGSL